MTSAAIQALHADPKLSGADRAANFGNGTEVSNSVNFTLTTTGELHAVPAEFQGRWVRITPHGSTLYYIFSTVDSFTPAVPGAATQAGTRAAEQCEGPYPDGTTIEVVVPKAASGESIYFGRIGGTAGQSVQMTLADGTYGVFGP